MSFDDTDRFLVSPVTTISPFRDQQRPARIAGTPDSSTSGAEPSSQTRRPQFACRLRGTAWMAIFTTLVLVEASAAADPPYRLEAIAKPGRSQRVKAILEVRGQLKLNASGQQVRELPLEVKGELTYDETVLPPSPRYGTRAVRYYDQASAAIRVDDHLQQSTLDDSARLVVVQSKGERLTLFSPLIPLTREQLDLIHLQGNSILLPRLLPNREVEIGETWQHAPELITPLLGLEAVNKATLNSTLSRVERHTAVIELTGTVSGAVNGVSTEIDLTGKYNFDLQRQRVTWLALGIKENRSIGHAEPGFDVEARLRLVALPIESSPHLTDEALAGLPLEIDPDAALLRFRTTTGGFQLLHDRRWQVMTDRPEVVIFRHADSGDLIAQCNVSRMADAPAETEFTLDKFRADIQAALGDRFGQFIDASEATNQNGLQVLKVIAAGTVADIPIQWHYYFLSDRKGRSGSFVFTLESSLAERFANADEILVETFEFADPPKPATPPQAPFGSPPVAGK